METSTVFAFLLVALIIIGMLAAQYLLESTDIGQISWPLLQLREMHNWASSVSVSPDGARHVGWKGQFYKEVDLMQRSFTTQYLGNDFGDILYMGYDDDGRLVAYSQHLFKKPLQI